MPLPFLLPLLAGAGKFVGDAIGGAFAARRQRRFAKENWQMQNEYNSPSATMARYRAAGINPGYAGQMNFGNAGSMPESANVTHKVEIPNVLNTLQEYYATKNAALENSRLSELLEQERMNTDNLRITKDYRWMDVVNDSAIKGFERDRKALDVDAYIESLKGGRNPYKQQFERGETSHQLDMQRLLQDREMFGITKQLSQLDLDWKKMGINPNDNMFVRILSRIFYDRMPKSMFQWQK